ncbi:hypothetical protein Tco_1292695 [Tanacetum coccineum]|uniref:Uncharacterized protein n=1 Tax=Tanacetum coccineum TaxID=301880 RepID=A0ABQ4Y452_9ASTR
MILLLPLWTVLKFGKCNMRLKTDIKPKEATFQVVLDALALTLFYRAFLITTNVPAIYMQEFWAMVSVHRDLGHTGDITYLTDVNVNYLYQPWRAFSTIINKCLSGKETGMDKICLSPEKIKLATKRSKKVFHVSHASGSGDGVDTQSKVLDEQQLNTSGKNEGTCTIIGVPDIPLYECESDKESWGDSEEEDDTDDNGDNDDDGESDDRDDDNDEERIESDRDEILDPNLTNVDQNKHVEEDVDNIVRTPLNYELTDDEKLDDEEIVDDEEDDEVIKELYDDVNVNLGNDDTEMTDADQGTLKQQNVSQESGFKQIEEDAHVTLTPVIDAHKADEPVQSSFVSSDFTSKLLNLENPSPDDNEIASLMETLDRHATAIPEITSGFTTTTPPTTSDL